MFEHYRAKGLIINKIDKGEADQLFTVYTRDFGRLEVVAKGIKKMTSKLRSQAELFYVVEIEFIQGKKYKTLTDARVFDKFKNIRSDLTKTKTVQRIAGLIDKLVLVPEPDKKIWNLACETFLFLELGGSKKTEAVYHYFFWNLLATLGWRFQTLNCCFCRKKLLPEKLLYFIPFEKGIICSDCLGKTVKSTPKILPIDTEIIKIIRLAMAQDLRTFSKIKLAVNQENKLELIAKEYLTAII